MMPADNPIPDCEPDQAWKALSLVNDWVKHAETKSATILAGAGVTGGVLYNLVKNEAKPGWWLTITAGLCGTAVILSGGCALLALTPRTGRISRLKTLASNLVRSLNDKLSGRRGAPAAPLNDETLELAAPPEGIAIAAVPVDADPSNLLFFAHIARDYANDSPTYTEVLSALTSDKKALCSAPGLMETSNTRRIGCYGGTEEVPG